MRYISSERCSFNFRICGDLNFFYITKEMITIFIQIDAHDPIDAHPPLPSSWHTKMGGINDFCFENAWIYDEMPLYLQLLCSLMVYFWSDIQPIIMYQLRIFLMPNGLLF